MFCTHNFRIVATSYRPRHAKHPWRIARWFIDFWTQMRPFLKFAIRPPPPKQFVVNYGHSVLYAKNNAHSSTNNERIPQRMKIVSNSLAQIKKCVDRKISNMNACQQQNNLTIFYRPRIIQWVFKKNTHISSACINVEYEAHCISISFFTH